MRLARARGALDQGDGPREEPCLGGVDLAAVQPAVQRVVERFGHEPLAVGRRPRGSPSRAGRAVSHH